MKREGFGFSGDRCHTCGRARCGDTSHIPLTRPGWSEVPDRLRRDPLPCEVPPLPEGWTQKAARKAGP